MKKNLIYLAALVGVILTALVAGIMLTDDQGDAMVDYAEIESDKVPVSLYEGDEFLEIYFDISENMTFPKLKREADVVVKVKACGKRLCYQKAIKTQVTVLDVLKGTDVNTNDKIFIYEPAEFDEGYEYTSDKGYNLLNDTDEYILFLKHLDVPKGYQYKKDEADTYLPSTLLYSKYNVSRQVGTKLVDRKGIENRKVLFQNVKDYEVFTTEKYALKRFQELKKQVMKMEK